MKFNMGDNQKMEKRTEIDRFESSSAENRRLLKQEELILEVTEMLSTALEKSGVSQAELARRLGKSKGFVSQLFAGGRNLTLRTISDLADALGVRVVVNQGRESEPEGISAQRRRSRNRIWRATTSVR
jgi:ribosome-binding protein aMBF1 (putative translation factor)